MIGQAGEVEGEGGKSLSERERKSLVRRGREAMGGEEGTDLARGPVEEAKKRWAREARRGDQR